MNFQPVFACGPSFEFVAIGLGIINAAAASFILGCFYVYTGRARLGTWLIALPVCLCGYIWHRLKG